MSSFFRKGWQKENPHPPRSADFSDTQGRSDAPPPYADRSVVVQDQKPTELCVEHGGSSYDASAALPDDRWCRTAKAPSGSASATTFHESPPTNPYDALGRYDTVFLIDDSGSMRGDNWRQTRQALAEIVPICTSYDQDGVDIYFLNCQNEKKEVRRADEVMALFDEVIPDGRTPTGARLKELLCNYMQQFRTDRSLKPMNIICITDGRPDDPKVLEKAIVSCGKELDSLDAPGRQVGVQFFQVGTNSAAETALQKLDNGLHEVHEVRDMVDTVSYKAIQKAGGFKANVVLKAVMGAIDKNLDKKWKM